MTIVVKLGGELLAPRRAGELDAIRRSLLALKENGARLVVAHGGGPQVTALMRDRGHEPRIVAGRRVTDEAALSALLMGVGGEVNARLTSALLEVGLDAVGLHGLAHKCVLCERQPPRRVAGSAGGELVDYGYVGDVKRVDRDFLDLFVDRGMTPVLACIGADERGQPLNVNGDALATALAAAVDARQLVFLTSTPGVLADPSKPDSRWARLDPDRARAGIASGAIGGGMIAKVEEAVAAVEAGVPEVFVLGGLSSGDLERALAEPGSVGTVFGG